DVLPEHLALGEVTVGDQVGAADGASAAARAAAGDAAAAAGRGVVGGAAARAARVRAATDAHADVGPAHEVAGAGVARQARAELGARGAIATVAVSLLDRRVTAGGDEYEK